MLLGVMYDIYIMYVLEINMHRTQLYIEEDTFSQIKKMAKSSNISISEFIRTAVKNELKKASSQNMNDFFEKLEPLESFENIDSSKYVNNIRSKSRIIND
jgi:hypothetical protein